MITYKTGDILAEPAEALVNTVNCVGIMGRGVALQFKRAFPDNFKAYAARCKRKQMRPGQVFVFERDVVVPPPVHHQLPDQAALAREESHRRHRVRAGVARTSNPNAMHPIDSHPSPRKRPGRAALAECAGSHGDRPEHIR